MSLLRVTLSREVGEFSPRRVACAIERARAATLVSEEGASTHVDLLATLPGPVTCIDLDTIESRYLLACDSRRTVQLFDLDAAPRPGSSGGGSALTPLHSHQPLRAAADVATETELAAAREEARGRDGGGRSFQGVLAGLEGVAQTGAGALSSGSSSGRPATAPPVTPAHVAAVSCCKWYAVDNGMFFSSGLDSRVVAWDTNLFAPAFTWSLPGSVWCLDVSPIAAHHSLVAAACEDGSIQLIDLSVSGIAQSLQGHADAAVTVAWSRTQEFTLLSGSRDGTIRAWDVRRPGATAMLTVFDQCATADPAGRGSGSGGVSAAAAAAARASSNPDVARAFSLTAPMLGHRGGVNCLHVSPWGQGSRVQRLHPCLRSGSSSNSSSGWGVFSSQPAAAAPTLGRRRAAAGDGNNSNTAAKRRRLDGAGSHSRGARGGYGEEEDDEEEEEEDDEHVGPRLRPAPRFDDETEGSSAGAASSSHLPTACSQPLSSWVFSSGGDHLPRKWGLALSMSSSGDGPGTATGGGGDEATTAPWVTAQAWHSIVPYLGSYNSNHRCIWAATAPVGRRGRLLLFHPNASRPATQGRGGVGGAGAEPGSISVYEADDGTLLGTLRAHTANVNAVVYRPTTQELLSCGDDGAVLRWRPELLAPQGGDAEEDEEAVPESLEPWEVGSRPAAPVTAAAAMAGLSASVWGPGRG